MPSANRGSPGAIAVPHHVGWTGADEHAHDPEIQPVWEICSCHGCYLEADHPLDQRSDLRDQMIDRVLSQGARFGFIASDSYPNRGAFMRCAPEGGHHDLFLLSLPGKATGPT